MSENKSFESNGIAQASKAEPKPCPAVVMTAIDFADQRFQVRDRLNDDAVQRYQKKIETQGMDSFDGKPLLWENPQTGKLTVMDGFHRLEAAKNAGLTHVPALLFEGTEAEATVLALKANLVHGVPLSREERKEACLKIIKAWNKEHGDEPSNPQLGEIMGVHESTAREWKQELATAGKYNPPTKIVGKDGKVQAAKKQRKTAANNSPSAASATVASQPKPATAATKGETPARRQPESAPVPIPSVHEQAPEGTPNTTSTEEDWLGDLEYACNDARLMAALEWAMIRDHDAFAEALTNLRQACDDALEARPGKRAAAA